MAIDDTFVRYYNTISANYVKENGIFDVMTKKLVEQFSQFGLTNEEKAKALSQIYNAEIGNMEQLATNAAIQLINNEKDFELKDGQIELVDEQIATEKRKRQGYDDNVLIEILKAQGGLASFAVNANSDTAQDTIDDLHAIMDKIEDRVCDIVCDTPTFDIEVSTDTATSVSTDLFGTTGMTFTIVEQPASGTLDVSTDGIATYTPANPGSYVAIIETADDANGQKVLTRIAYQVSSVAEAQGA